MKRIARALLNYFFKGLIVVVPIGAALFLVFWAITSVDNALNISDVFTDSKGRPIHIPGLGIANVLLVIMVAGILVTNVIQILSNFGSSAGLTVCLSSIFYTLQLRI